MKNDSGLEGLGKMQLKHAIQTFYIDFGSVKECAKHGPMHLLLCMAKILFQYREGVANGTLPFQ
jgi:hypothetical protein